ncbi:MAG: hypothetical protein VYA10_02430 [Verrucomicrobiota bacterium]|nr:hypothetical protein [Verrucomicrobiota bacterium]
MHEDEDTKIILEKRYSHKITGCMLFVLPLPWLVAGLVGPPAYLVGAVFYGLLFLVLLGKYVFKDLSDSENIVITSVGVHLGAGFCSIKIDWHDLGELYTKTHTSSHSSSSGHGEVVVETDVINLETKARIEGQSPIPGPLGKHSANKRMRIGLGFMSCLPTNQTATIDDNYESFSSPSLLPHDVSPVFHLGCVVRSHVDLFGYP